MTLIIFLLLMGILLMLLEIFVIPGIGIAGVLGVICFGVSIWLAYQLSMTTGHLVIAISVLASIFALTIALRSNTWNKVALHKKIDGKVNVEIEENIKVGDVGETVSRLMPMGKARINDMFVEVHSTGQFIPQKTEIEVIKIDHTKIIVKTKKS